MANYRTLFDEIASGIIASDENTSDQDISGVIARGASKSLRLFLQNEPPNDWYSYQDNYRGTLPAFAIKSANLPAIHLILQYLPLQPVSLNPPRKPIENVLWAAIEMSKERPYVLNFVLRRLRQPEFGQYLEICAFAKMSDTGGRCALHLAAQMEARVAFVSISNRASPRATRELAERQMCEVKDSDGLTPLHLAACHSNAKTLRLLSGYCAAPIPDNLGETILHKAVTPKSPDMEKIRFILAKYPNMVKRRNHAGVSPLRALLEKEADKVSFTKLQQDDESLQSGSYSTINHYDKTLEVLLMKHTFQRCIALEEVRLALKINHSNDLYFDLSFLPRGKFPAYMADRKVSNIQLFPFLKFVKLPDLQCSNESPCLTTEKGGRLHPEALEAFGYLRQREVTHIDKVVIPDCTIHPHSDEEIRASLHGFRIRGIEWRKRDLSVSALHEVLGSVESLHLHSSGNEDILTYWAHYWRFHIQRLQDLRQEGRPHGLTALQINISRTELLHLSQQDIRDYESKWNMIFRNAIHSNHGFPRSEIPQCQICLNDVKVNVEPEPTPEPPRSSEDDHGGSVSALGPHHPETILTKMAPLLDMIGELQGDDTPGATFAVQNPIKVAIIDSGVYCFEYINDKCVGRSFIEDDTTPLADTHWHSPSNSHGTMLARLIFEMNPWCEFYIAKVKHGLDQGGVDILRAVEAIKWASEQEVDVICLSWSITETDAGADRKALLADAISKTTAIVIASTGDKGPTVGEERPLPAKVGKTIAITAADMHHQKCEDADDNQTDFYFASEGLEVDGLPQYLEDSGKKLATGSSYATALAAGIAALFLTCAQLAYYKEHQEITMRNKITNLKNEEVKAIFRRLCGWGQGNSKFVKPWDFFRNEWSRKKPEEKLLALKERLDNILRP